MKTKLLILTLLFSAIGISQGTTSNRLIGVNYEPIITFFEDDSYIEFEYSEIDIYAGYAVAVNPGDSLVYGLISEGDMENRDLYRFNPFTGEKELVFDFDINHINSADIGSDGIVYMITGNGADEPGQIYTLDPSSGAFELLFNTGLLGPWGLEYNSSNNSIYIFRGNDGEEHFVHKFDPESGEFIEMPLEGAEETEIHGAYYIEEENKFLITEYYGDLRETVSEEYNVTESVHLSDNYGLMDVCEILTLRAEGPNIDMDACPGDASAKIELLYSVNDVEWYKDGELIEGAEDEVYFATETGVYQARMQIGDTENYLLSESISVEFYTVPVVEVTQEDDDHLMCPGETILLEGSTPGGGSVQWYMNGEEIDGASEANYTVTEPGVYNQLKTNMSGCSDSAAVSFVIEMDALPIVDLTLGDDEFLCPDETVEINGLSDEDMQWYFNGEAIDGEIGESINISEAGVYNQYVINEFGCADSAAVGITIVEVENPVVELSTDGEDLILCTEETLVIEGSGGDENQWYKDGVAIDGETDLTIEVSEGGYYNMLVINEYGCADSAGVGILIEVGELPIVEITNIDDDHLICPEESIVLEGTTGVTMQWYKDGVEILGEDGANYTAVEPGDYNQYVTNDMGCRDDAAMDYMIEADPDCGASITENSGIEITFYPNPVLDNLTISSEALISDILVYDVSGTVVLELHNNSSNQVILNYTDLSNGVYIVNVITNQGIRIIKTQK